MTAHRSAAGPRYAHPDHDRASPGTFLVHPLRMLLGYPLCCPTPAGTKTTRAKPQAEQDERERQTQERQETEAAQASRTGGWLGRRRS